VKPKNKRQKFVIPKGIRVLIVVSYVSLNFHLHDTLHHTFAFINIHLVIHRIIIIITYTLASALKEKTSEKREKRQFYALLCTKRREGVFRLRLKNINFVHNKALYTLTERSFLSYFYRLLELRQHSWSFVFLLRSFSFGFVILYVSIIS
jgi:hypothetical protein